MIAVPVPFTTDHVPPAFGLVKVGDDAPLHIVAEPPVIAPGVCCIVIVPDVTKHPVGNVYLTATLPADIPVNTPPALILAVPVVAITDHVPPPGALVKAGVDAPVQTVADPPAIAAGKGFTVKVAADVAEPFGFVT